MSLAPELLVTADDLERLSARGERYELIWGRLEPMSPVGGDQGEATVYLSAELTTHVRRWKLGRCFAAETGFLLAQNPDLVLAPDWAFVSRERAPVGRLPKFVPVVPDVVLETRSPNDSDAQVRRKIDQWLQAGVRVAWDLDPERRTLTVHRQGTAPRALGPKDELTEPELLPGFALRVGEVF